MSRRTTPHHLSRKDLLKGAANRFVFSRPYMILYSILAILSIITVAISFREACPGWKFYLLELVVNLAMIAEVTVRWVAFGRQFWKSPFNIADIFLVILCVVTVLVILGGGGDCSKGKQQEEVFDTVLLVVRNVVQVVRIFVVLRRNGSTIINASRTANIDFSTLHTRDFSLDIDLYDEEAETRDRMQGFIPDDEDDEATRMPLQRGQSYHDSDAH